MYRAISLWQRWLNWRGLLVVIFIGSLLIANSGLSYATTLTPPFAQTNPGNNQSAQLPIAGTFYIISGGPDPLYYLLDDNGQNSQLFIDPAVLAAGGGGTYLNRKRVRLSGSTIGASRTLNGGPALLVAAIELDTTPGNYSPITQAITGTRPFVNLLCRFGDSPAVTPQEPSYFTGLMSNVRPGLDHYFRETSLGAIDLVGTQVAGWYNLPQPRAYYFTADPPNFQRMAEDCSALADGVINFNDFQGINFVFNVNFGCCAWGGAIGLTLDNTTKIWPATWMPPGGFFQSIWAHEMGHAFGMPHSANAIGTTYQNAWDVMSQDRFNCAADTDPTYGCVGQHSIAYHKDIPGWIPDNRKFVPPPDGGTFNITLERLAQPGSSGYLMAKIPISGSNTRYYTVEARYRLGYDTKVANDAVVIHEVDNTRLDDAWLVDADGNATSSDDGAQWLVGETFSDPANGIAISVISATATGFVISINVAPPPTLTINAPAINANIGSGSATNWFKFTAPIASVYTLETFGGAINDTVMRLYGPGNTTTLLAQNDDIGGGNLLSKINRRFLNPGTYYVAVNAKPGSATGNYSISLIAPLLVTKNQDVPGQPGSLSYAVEQALPADTVWLVPQAGNIIQLNQSVVINKNITIQGQCANNVPAIMLNGSSAAPGTDGLVLNSQVTLSGIRISGFPGKQIKASGGVTKLICVQATKDLPN
jgi:hypothetical protein